MSNSNTGSLAISFLVRPEDPLHFGLPASTPAGEVHHGPTLFPPPFSAWQGLLRTRLLIASSFAHELGDRSAQARQARERVIGTPEALPFGWQIDGPWPVTVESTKWGLRSEAWFPVPRFLFTHAEDRYALGRVLEGPSAAGLSSDLNHLELLPVGVPELGRAQPAEGWVSAAVMDKLLRGTWHPNRRLSNEVHHPFPPCVEEERRAGLAVDSKTAAAREGLLYFRKQLRFSPKGGLAGGLEVSSWPSEVDPEALTTGMGRLGAGAGTVSFSMLPKQTSEWGSIINGEHLPERLEAGERAWLLLATPAALGGNPIVPVLPSPPFEEVTIRVRAALLGKALVLGGLSIRGRGRVEPRPNRPYVPAGSAWLIQIEGGTAEQRAMTLRSLHNRCTLGREEERPFGTGRTFVGLYPSPLRRQHQEADL
jgi:CRISPR-associated protein Cmr3